ncbi:hypothetical protein B1810_01230 [Panacagrimonas perspica]|nr:hypothetical protein B1810_01230 [Panacagrimonas perspica]
MPDDRELEDFLAGRHPVGKAYREASGQDTAPPELDALILGAAREAVRTPRARRPRWFQPVAVAATLALSLGVLLNIWRDPGTREQMAPAESSDLDRMKAQALEEGVSPAVVEAKKEAGPVVSESPAVAELAAPAEPVEAEAERRADAVAARREEKSSSSDEPRKAKESVSNRTANEALSAGAAAPKAAAPRLEPAKPEAPMPEPAASASSYGFVPEPPAAAAAAPPPPPAPVTGPSPGAQRAVPFGAAADRALDDRVEQAPRDEAKDMKRSRDSVGSMAGGRSGAASEEDGAAAGALAPRAATSSAPVMAPAAKSSQPEAEAADSFAPAPPEDWIRRIRELRDGGDIAAAKKLLDSFRSRYPDYVLPKDLRELQTP